MRLRMAAAATAAIGLLRAPVTSVMIAVSVAYGWLIWRAVATR
jgi:hypothetical protein